MGNEHLITETRTVVVVEKPVQHDLVYAERETTRLVTGEGPVTNIVTANPTTIIKTGHSAPQGRPGSQGPAAGRFEHVQSTPTQLWLIEHELGYRPYLQTFEDTGEEIVGEVTHLDENSLQVWFSESVSGWAVAL